MIAPSSQLGASMQLRAYRPDLAARPASPGNAPDPTSGTAPQETDERTPEPAADSRKGLRLDVYG
ncbi:MAG: hypothetical protein KC518_01595 [Candidatus Cloacimonetes bacterium]|nr:hypothetical protein [Candidatus Cloacimonadota bacterium]